MKTLPRPSNHKTEFLAQCDQEQLAKAKAGDEVAKTALTKEFEIYQQEKNKAVEEERLLTGAANLAEFKANPEACIAAMEAEGGQSLYVYEIAEARGLFRVSSERWSREAGGQFGRGTDWGGKVASKDWKAVIEIGDRRYDITGNSYYAAPQRHEAVCAEAWKTLLKTVGIE